MKSFKVIHEDAQDEQKARREKETALIGTLEKHYNNLSAHHNILHNFTYKSHGINSHLWNKGNPTPSIQELDSIIHNHKTPESMIVWSKSIHDPNKLKDHTGMVHHPAYLSTSVRKSVIDHDYAQRNIVHDNGINHHHIYKISVPKGHPGVYVPDAHNYDSRAKEFILPRDSNLYHHLTSTVAYNNENHYHTHTMEVLPHEK